METTDIIKGLRAEIAALSARIDELEKQLADNEELADTVEPAVDIEASADALPAEDAEPAADALPAEEAEPAADALHAEDAEPAAALDLDIDIDIQGAATLPDLHSFQWMTDMPGSEVANMISGISLNDRVLFINTLFREDPGLFQSTISSLNGMKSMDDAVAWLVERFPEWNLGSEVVYRFMMAARRKLK